MTPSPTTMSPLLKDLRARWEDLTSFLSDQVKEKWWSRIVENYTPRPFHNLEHLAEELAYFDTYKDKLKDRYGVAFAIFFKHLEHDPKSVGGEDAERNAQRVHEFGSETTLDQENYVAGLIVESGKNCTEAHMQAGEYGAEDLHYLIDFDTAWMGSEWETYNRKRLAVREEHLQLSDEDYDTQRAKVLQLFLQIPNIFATREFRERFETRARENLQREIGLIAKSQE